MTLTQISEKLLELADKYAEVLPKFHVAELNYTNMQAKVLMSQDIVGLASQPLRDAECKRMMSETNEYVEYNKLLPEIKIIEMQLRVYQQISKNLVSQGWGESTNGS